MTNLQVSYNQLLETRRNNQAQLAENQRHNLATERLTQLKQAQDWQIASGQLDVARGNLGVAQLRQSEDARHDLQTEATGWYNAAALNEHYKRADSNDRRGNFIRFYDAATDKNIRQQDVDNTREQMREQARQNRRTLGENIRSNVAKETENSRHNLAQERENIRHNKQAEKAAVWQNINGSFNAFGNILSGVGKKASPIKIK